MSRLDEALRRAATPSRPSPVPEGRQKDVFASPWTVSQEVPTVAPKGVAASESRRMVATRIEGSDTRWKDWLVSSERDPAVTDQFRRLAATLIQAQKDSRLRVILVTSAVPGEGKTLTALNLALVLAESYRRSVLLIDADLRRPRLSEASGLTVTAGLGEALKLEDERKVSVVQLTEHLTLLPAGEPDPQPLSGLTSPRMHHLLEEGAERFDWVILDAPPVGAAPDAGLLGQMVDGTILVVRAGVAPLTAVRRAVEVLGQDRIVGVVLNGVEYKSINAYGEYSYGEYSDKGKAKS